VWLTTVQYSYLHRIIADIALQLFLHRNPMTKTTSRKFLGTGYEFISGTSNLWCLLESNTTLPCHFHKPRGSLRSPHRNERACCLLFVIVKFTRAKSIPRVSKNNNGITELPGPLANALETLSKEYERRRAELETWYSTIREPYGVPGSGPQYCSTN
jgi:hypothetical protein